MPIIVFAHRGASGRYAEHTRAAYLQAIDEQADGVECDVHLSRDGHLVLIHDSDLERTSDGTGSVEDYTLAELRTLDFCSWKDAVVPAEFGGIGEQFLTLAELLDILQLAGRPIRLAIECKHPSPFGAELEAAVFRLLVAAGWTTAESRIGDISISFMSFDPASVHRLLETVPAQHVCQLLENAPAGPRGGDVREAFRQGENLISGQRVGLAGPGLDYIRAHPQLVGQWADAGMRFRVWTVNTAADISLCTDLGIQEVTTDHPARVAELFAAAGVGGGRG